MPGKKYSPKQKKLARVAAPRNKITGADFQAAWKQREEKESTRMNKDKLRRRAC